MDLARRAFLFVAGAAGGALITPIPWKMADDTAIWSQNWWFRASPERGEITKTTTVCQFCDGGCGIQARLVNGNRAIMLEGNPEHPVNGGGICPLGASGLQFLYAPYRVTQPLKQMKARGDATGFEPISWDAALSELGAKLAALRGEERAHTVACITGQRRSSMYALWRRLFAAYGSQNLFAMPCHTDSQELAANLAMGLEASFSFALERAGYVLNFGAGLLEGWGAPSRTLAAYSRWRNESPEQSPVTLVHVDSRCSTTAAKADQWVAVKPGSEAALALGIAHVIIRDGLFDSDYMAQNVFGFEDWTDIRGETREGFKKLVAHDYTPEKVSEMTGVAPALVEQVAKDLATRRNALVVWGRGKGRQAENTYHDLAFLALNVLIGNLKPEGLLGLVPKAPLESFNPPEKDSLAYRSLRQPRLDLVANKDLPLPGHSVHSFLDTLRGTPPYPIEVLLIHEANPAYSLAGSRLFQAAAAKVGMLVSFASYLDETAQQADLILPNHAALERYDDVTELPGAPYAYYAVATPILPPHKDTRHTGDVILGLKDQLGDTVKGSLPWGSYEEYLKARVGALAESQKGAVSDGKGPEPGQLKPGQTLQPNFKDGKDLWKQLTKGGCWYDAPGAVADSIQTTSGKYELACQMLQKKGFIKELDRLYLPHFNPLEPSGTAEKHPLLLLTYQDINISDQYLPNPPFMNKTVYETLLLGTELFVEVNPQTAKGFREGDKAFLQTHQVGELLEVPVRVHLTERVPPGTVFVAQGFGHSAYMSDQYVVGKGINANEVIEVQLDPITGLGTVWATRAQLRRRA